MRRILATAAALALTPLAATDAPAAAASPATYTNPVSAGFADTFADPSIIRGRDGAWYAYGTSDPLRSGEGTPHQIPIGRSTDLVHWTHAGDALKGVARPPYATPTAAFWAPDIRYTGGRYVMYFAVTDTTVSADTFDTAIGAATAPTPTGPWTVAPEPVVAPRPAAGGGYQWTIDPAQFTDTDGRRYLYWGSYAGGIWVDRLSADGLHSAGHPVHVAINDRYEGGYVVHHGGYYYYLFASSANCCAGPTTGYSISVSRAASPLGPFTDRYGVRMDSSSPGGTPVISPNGNRWVGTGHNAVITDLSGQDWLVYHAIDRNHPYLDQPFGVNRRPMMIDRLDWIGGWPVVRAGAGASDGPQPAPVARGAVDARFDGGGLPSGWRATGTGWQVTGGVARHTGGGSAGLVAGGALPPDRRVEADLRVGAGATGGLRVADGITVTVDAAHGRLTARTPAGTRAVPLPAGADPADWHDLAVEVRGRTLTASLGPDGLGDPVARVAARLPRPAAGPAGVVAGGGTVEADDVRAARLYRPVTRAVSEPRTGPLLPAYSDEFDGGALGTGWTWVRPDPAVTVGGGTLNWPVQDGDLVGSANAASVLLRDAPRGNYVVETRLTLDVGTDAVRNYQQGGLVAYVNDDDFARLDKVAIQTTRQVEFGHEMPYAGGLPYGGTTFGTAATTMWLRLAHRIDPATGEHEFRAGASRDGRHWVWSGTWTFPANTTPRIGLVSHGGARPAATTHFAYFHVYRG